MRVALVCGEFSPDKDGVADYVARLAQALPALEVEPVIVSSTSSQGDCQRVCTSWSAAGIRAAGRSIAALRPDVVHVQWAPSAYAWSPWVGLLPALVRVPVVTTLHEYGWWSWPARVPDRVWRQLECARVWDRETLLLGPRSSALIATNPEHARLVHVRLRREPAVVPIGPNVTASALSGPEARRAVCARWGVPTDAPLLVFFGFVHPMKGVRYLLDGLAAVRRTAVGRAARLVVAGGFESLALPREEALAFHAELLEHAREAGVAEAVTWTGHVPEDQVSHLLRAADAVVLPLTAGVTAKSGALLAAFDHGACVVATLPGTPTGPGGPVAERADPPADVLVDGREVVVIARRRDSAAVADALVRVLGSPALRRRVASGGRERARGRSWPEIASAHVNIYERLVP